MKTHISKLCMVRANPSFVFAISARSGCVFLALFSLGIHVSIVPNSLQEIRATI